MVILKPFRIYGSKLALLHNGVPSYISEESEYRKSQLLKRRSLVLEDRDCVEL